MPFLNADHFEFFNGYCKAHKKDSTRNATKIRGALEVEQALKMPMENKGYINAFGPPPAKPTRLQTLSELGSDFLNILHKLRRVAEICCFHV